MQTAEIRLDYKMSDVITEYYGTEQGNMMRTFVTTLDEKQRRLFFGLEASRLGHGGKQLLADGFSTSPSVIRRGERELLDPSRLPQGGEVRQPGGGNKLVEERDPEILPALEKIMGCHIAGDPMNGSVRWTDLRTSQIRDELADEGFDISAKTVKRLLKKTTR